MLSFKSYIFVIHVCTYC